MIVILWSILSTTGLIVAVWYLSAIRNPHGESNYPLVLWGNVGHLVSQMLIIMGVASLVGLYISTQDSFLFFKILAGILALVFLVKLKLTPLEMSFTDVMGTLYSGGGLLRFGGFQTADFLDATKPLDEKSQGIREKIIAEAHYLVFWLDRFPEMAFFFGIVLYRSLLVALLLFVAAFILEIIRFYLFGSSLFLSQVCRAWNWMKIPLFIVAAISLWPEGSFLPIALVVFLVVQGWFGLVASVGMLPIRAIAGRLIYKKYGGHWHNMEGMALNFVINRWRQKLLA